MKTTRDFYGNTVPYMSLNDLRKEVDKLISLHGGDVMVTVEVFTGTQVLLAMPELKLDTIKYKSGNRKVLRISFAEE